MQILRAILIIAVALVSSRGIAANPSTERWLAYQLASVTVAADGSVQQATLPGSTLSPAMQEQVLSRVRAFEFEPATRDGVAGVTETTVWVKLALETDQDQLLLKVIGGDITVGMDRLKAPRYPALQLRRMQGAEVELRVAYDAQGVVTDVSVTRAEPDLKAFKVAAIKAARQWQVRPERIDGVGVAGTVVVPVRFEVAGQNNDSGKINFPDGGSLQVSRELEQPDQLLSSTLRLRATEG